MLSANKDKVKITAEIIRKGGTILGEPCKICGGVQVRYKERTFCVVHEDIEKVLSEPELTIEDVKSNLKGVLLAKIDEIRVLLSNEKDTEAQEKYANLLIRYFELLKELG